MIKYNTIQYNNSNNNNSNNKGNNNNIYIYIHSITHVSHRISFVLPDCQGFVPTSVGCHAVGGNLPAAQRGLAFGAANNVDWFGKEHRVIPKNATLLDAT